MLAILIEFEVKPECHEAFEAKLRADAADLVVGALGAVERFQPLPVNLAHLMAAHLQGRRHLPVLDRERVRRENELANLLGISAGCELLSCVGVR